MPSSSYYALDGMFYQSQTMSIDGIFLRTPTIARCVTSFRRSK